MPETLQDRLIRYLQDAHAAETGVEEALSGYLNDTDDPDVRTLFDRQLIDVRSQAQKIEHRLTNLGYRPSGGKGFLNSLMAKASDFINVAHDSYDRTTQNLVKAYSTAHLKRGMYEAMATYAIAIGDMETANLARGLQQGAEIAASELFPLIAAFTTLIPVPAEVAPAAYPA